MPERDTELFQISISQIGEHREINVVLGKPLRVLPEVELFEPLCNLLHSRPHRFYWLPSITPIPPATPSLALDRACQNLQ